MLNEIIARARQSSRKQGAAVLLFRKTRVPFDDAINGENDTKKIRALSSVKSRHFVGAMS